jgi:hypothetical protein
MQREEPEGIIISCDFCTRDWDGQEAMIEGHHGSILCLECLKLALVEQLARPGKFKCTLCLRFNMPPEMPRWSNAEHPNATACQECIYQAAKAFHKNKDIPFRWDPAHDPPPIHLPPPTPDTPANPDPN